MNTYFLCGTSIVLLVTFIITLGRTKDLKSEIQYDGFILTMTPLLSLLVMIFLLQFNGVEFITKIITNFGYQDLHIAIILSIVGIYISLVTITEDLIKNIDAFVYVILHPITIFKKK